MAKVFIQVSRVDTNAIFAGKLIALVAKVRDTIEELDEVKALMDNMQAGADVTDLELRFGIPAGQGQNAYNFVKNAREAIRGIAQNTDALTLVDRVG
jgi:hypothetical protein